VPARQANRLIVARGGEDAMPGHTVDSLQPERKPLWKAIRVLQWMVENEGEFWGVREIGRGVHLSPSTVHRVLGALEEHGLVRSDAATGQYGLGLEFFRMAWKSTSRLALRNVATPILEELTKQTNETDFLALLDRNRMQVMFGLSVECTHGLRYVVRLNEWSELYLGASGHAILAFLPPGESQLVLKRLAHHSLRDPSLPKVDRLAATLGTIRTRGYACTVGQRVSGAMGIAAPIFDSRTQVIADVGLSIPELRFASGDEGRVADLVIEAAKRISSLIGGDWMRACAGVNQTYASAAPDAPTVRLRPPH
jgi:IclR family transcriptional regulator, acetate operon repressor